MNTLTKRILFWTIVAAVMAISIFVVLQGAEPGPDVDVDIEIGEINELDWTKGNPDAKITLIEYSDFECPACQQYAALVDNALKEFGNHIYFAYRHFPLKGIHKNAMPAARAANAAGEQGEFFEMHNLLFLNKTIWDLSDQKKMEEGFLQFAETLDLDTEKFIEDYDSKENIQKVEAAYNNAIKGGLTYTPTFILNGEIVKMPGDPKEFNNIIRDAVEAAEAK